MFIREVWGLKGKEERIWTLMPRSGVKRNVLIKFSFNLIYWWTSQHEYYIKCNNTITTITDCYSLILSLLPVGGFPVTFPCQFNLSVPYLHSPVIKQSVVFQISYNSTGSLRPIICSTSSFGFFSVQVILNIVR